MDEHLLRDVVAEQPYPLLFVTISGSHLYGFPSPDSDYDLRGVYRLPAAEVVGLRQPQETLQVTAERGGREIDLVTHDAGKFFRLLRPPLSQLRRDPVAVVRAGRPATRQAAALHLPGFADRHPPDADR